MTRRQLPLLLPLLLWRVASAQTPVLHGVVQRVEGHAPVAGALVRLRKAGTQAATAFNGAFWLATPSAHDTLIVTAIGFLPDTVPLPSPAVDTITIALHEAPLTLSALVASTTSAEQLASGQSETWKVSGSALRALPAAVEADVNRSLALVPGVSFTSLLSARPMLRGLDADDAMTTIDGFEAINLYHIGRFFSAVPALAVDHADVRFQPAGADLGGTTAGQIDLVGRSGTTASSGDVQYAASSLSASVGDGSPSGATSVFAAARTVRTSLLDEVLTDNNVHYDFQDLYTNVHAAPAGIPTMVSLFASSDHVTPDTSVSTPEDSRMDWSNVVLGVRSDLVRAPSAGVTASLAYADHDETSDDIPARGAVVDVRNHLSTLTGRIDGHDAVGQNWAVRYGASATRRDVENVITPLGFETFLATNRNEQRTELGSYGEIDHHSGNVDVTGGVRIDHADGIAVVQPRFTVRVAGAHNGWVELAAGRSARLFHLVSDSRSEPKYAYYDIWLPAGVDGTPAATMDNLSLAAARTFGPWQLRADVFGGWGDGEVDLLPQLTNADSGNIFRYGRSRVRGADASAVSGAADGRWSVGLSYTYTVSERNWGGGWVPWISDRRHEARFFGTVRVAKSVRLATSVEAASSMPFTPIIGWLEVYSPASISQPSFGGFRPVYGAEMSARGTALLRFDGTLTKEFRGPWQSRWEAGVGVSSLSVGDQAPRADSLRFHSGIPPQGYVTEAPLFSLPVVPSIVLRGQFGARH